MQNILFYHRDTEVQRIHEFSVPLCLCGKIKYSAWLFAFVLLCSIPSYLVSGLIPEGTLEVQGGYRVDSLNWSIAGSNNSPNILSELIWEDLQMFQVSSTFRAYLLAGIYGRCDASYGWILSGKSQDSDYDGDNRTLEFSRSNSRSDGDNVLDLSWGLGWTYSLWPLPIKISPVGGYSYHEQNVRMSDGVQTISENPAQLGPIIGLNSTYRTQWHGPWTGVDIALDFCGLILGGSYEVHVASYRAKGHWNLRTDFIDDFRHEANGFGQVVNAEVYYPFSDMCFVGLNIKYQDWYTAPGIDRTFVSVDILDEEERHIGTMPGLAQTRLNRVNWHSFAAMFLFAIRF